MSQELRRRIFQELSSLKLIDPHTHINAHAPASANLADILGYHYYTELAHSAGMPKADIEDAGLSPREKVGRLIANFGPIDNTIQHSWFVEMAQSLLGFSDERITADNWESLYDLAEQQMSRPDWADEVLEKSSLEAVFLTNDFDDPLEGFDTQRYIPCLRTDDLVFHLDQLEVRDRLEKATGGALSGVASLRAAIGQLFDHFVRRGAKACAISLPPDFAPAKVSDARAATALEHVLIRGRNSAETHRRALAHFVFWTLAERCSDYRLPFDLMIGVNRGVYAGGVFQGRDLYDSRVSLIQYRELFNQMPDVTFPVSVLASVTNQELTSYAWIFPNVVTNGHWWYSNTPAFIEHDAAARLEAVPRTKQIGYYSDMYKLEFALPKFNMYKRILAKILAERFVIDRGWSEEQAVSLGRQVLRGNVETLFRVGQHDDGPYLPTSLGASPSRDDDRDGILEEDDASDDTLDAGAVAAAVATAAAFPPVAEAAPAVAHEDADSSPFAFLDAAPAPSAPQLRIADESDDEIDEGNEEGTVGVDGIDDGGDVDAGGEAEASVDSGTATIDDLGATLAEVDLSDDFELRRDIAGDGPGDDLEELDLDDIELAEDEDYDDV